MNVFKSEESKRQILQRYDEILSVFPFKQRYIDTGYGKTFFLEAGEENEQAVILLHGSCSNSAFWFFEISALSQGYHVYAFDIPGEAGNSAENRFDLSTNAYADWLKEVTDTLGIDRATVIGNSLGGWMALKFAVTYPGRIAKLALIAASGLSKQNPATMNDMKTGQTALGNEVLDGAQLPEAVLTFINMILSGFLPLREELPVFSDVQLSALTMPVLFVAGEKDVMTDAVAAADRLRAILPHADVRLLPEVGHIVLNPLAYLAPFLAGEDC
jgi:pimeloyl-ACP methyl ester carboxylesterase